MLVLSILACVSGPLALDVTVDGFSGDDLSRAFWVQQTLRSEETGTTEVEHSLMLTNADVTCEDVQVLDDDLSDLYDAEAAAEGGIAACEAEAEWYGALSDAMGAWGAPGTLTISFILWDTVSDGDHIGVLPESGTYTPLDGPDADIIEWAGFGEWTLQDWFGHAAERLDCSAEDPWEAVSAQDESFVLYDGSAGELVLTLLDDRVDFELGSAELAYDQGGLDSETYDPLVLDGVGSFLPCETERVLPISDPETP